MAENDNSWLQKDDSWRKTTAHGEARAHKGLIMKTMNGIMRRLPIKGADGSIDLIEIDGIFYLEAQGENTIIRTKRKKTYKSVQRLGEMAKKLPAPAFVRCHREYIVNLNRVRSLTPRNSRDYDLRLDPPVNRRIPIARDRLEKIRNVLGQWGRP